MVTGITQQVKKDTELPSSIIARTYEYRRRFSAEEAAGRLRDAGLLPEKA
jgi:hypothetical protein